MTPAQEQLAQEYLAAKGPYNAALVRKQKADAVLEAATLVLLEAKAAFVASGGQLTDLPPAQPEIDTPPTVDEDGNPLPGHPAYVETEA